MLIALNVYLLIILQYLFFACGQYSSNNSIMTLMSYASFVAVAGWFQNWLYYCLLSLCMSQLNVA